MDIWLEQEQGSWRRMLLLFAEEKEAEEEPGKDDEEGRTWRLGKLRSQSILNIASRQRDANNIPSVTKLISI